MAKAKKIVVVEETIIKKIIFLRDEKIMLDVHLAELYGVETRVLKQAGEGTGVVFRMILCLN
jgi:hypothetical protein